SPAQARKRMTASRSRQPKRSRGEEVPDSCSLRSTHHDREDRMTREAEELEFDQDESPTRRSGIVLAQARARETARETEALLAQLDAIVHIAVSFEELTWFPLGGESSAIIAAADGRAT